MEVEIFLTFMLGHVCFVFKKARAPRHFLIDKRAPYGEFVNFF